MMGGFFASLLGKAISAAVGATLTVGALLYVRHVRAENTRLETENVALVRDRDLLRLNAALAMRITARAADREDKLRIDTEKEVEAIRRVKIPKLPPPCKALCARSYDPIRASFGMRIDVPAASGGPARPGVQTPKRTATPALPGR
jgi:hypothetical protein